MGRTGSGRRRWRKRGPLDFGPILDIRMLRRRGYLVDGKRLTVTLRWNWQLKGTEIAKADLITDLTKPSSRHTTVITEYNGQLRLQQIAIIARKAPFGGLRMFFRCPILGIDCEVMPLGTHGFTSRQASQLSYLSQSEAGLTRLVSAKLKLHDRLWPLGGYRRAFRGAKRVRMLNRYWELEFAIDEVIDG